MTYKDCIHILLLYMQFFTIFQLLFHDCQNPHLPIIVILPTVNNTFVEEKESQIFYLRFLFYDKKQVTICVCAGGEEG